MNVFIPLGLFLVLLCFFFRNNPKNSRKAFFFSMIAAFIFAAIRYEFGPDYFNYHEIYDSIQGADLDRYVGKGMTVEPAFLFLLKLFPNFTSFVCFLAIVWFIPTFYFINRYVPSNYYWLVVLFMFIKSDYFISSLVAMRTTLCSAIFLVALFFLLKKKRIIYIGLILLASQFHTSSIVLVLFVLFSFKSQKIIFNNITLIVLGLLAFISFASGQNQLIEMMSSFVIENVDELQRYAERETGGVGQSINTLIFRLISFFILLYLAKSGEREKEEEKILLYKIAFCAAAITLIFGQSLISDRYLLILNPVYIACIILSFNKNPKNINILITTFILVIALYIFYNKSTRSYFVTFMDYYTIFSAPYIP